MQSKNLTFVHWTKFPETKYPLISLKCSGVIQDFVLIYFQNGLPKDGDIENLFDAIILIFKLRRHRRWWNDLNLKWVELNWSRWLLVYVTKNKLRGSTITFPHSAVITESHPSDNCTGTFVWQARHYDLDANNPDGCAPCNCDPGASTSLECPADTGMCTCMENIGGRDCRTPSSGNYVPKLDAMTYDAEFAYNATVSAFQSKLETFSAYVFIWRFSSLARAQSLLLQRRKKCLSENE